MFKEGSYWIYKDSITNNVDSVILTQSLIEYIEEHEGEWVATIRKMELYKGECSHYLSDTTIFRSYRIEPEVVNCFPIIVFNSGIQDLEKNIGLCVSAIDRHARISYLPSYSIEENNFNDVKIVWQKHPIRVQPEDYYTTDFYIRSYWAKNIGLIRYELYNSNEEILNTYNLVKYNVKPYNK